MHGTLQHPSRLLPSGLALRYIGVWNASGRLWVKVDGRVALLTDYDLLLLLLKELSGATNASSPLQPPALIGC